MNNFILKISLIFFTVSVSDTGFVVSILRYIKCSYIDGKYRYRRTDISVLLVSIQYRGNASREFVTTLDGVFAHSLKFKEFKNYKND